MNLQSLKGELNSLKYQKSQLLFLSGEKKKFEKLAKALPDCELLSTRDLLLNACQKREIHELNQDRASQILKEVLKGEKGNTIALVDNELLIKFGLFTTTMKGQVFHQIPFIIHIPETYKKHMKNTIMHTLE